MTDKTMINPEIYKKSVQRAVDTLIFDKLKTHAAVLSVQCELTNRILGLRKALEVVNINIKSDPMSLGIIYSDPDWLEKITSTRERYFLYNIYYTYKRIDDLQWMIDNRFRDPQIKLSHLFNHQLFKLIKLKERLDPKVEVFF